MRGLTFRTTAASPSKMREGLGLQEKVGARCREREARLQKVLAEPPRAHRKGKTPGVHLDSHSPLRCFWYAKSARGRWASAERACTGMRWNYYLSHGKRTPRFAPHEPLAIPPAVNGRMRSMKAGKQEHAACGHGQDAHANHSQSAMHRTENGKRSHATDAGVEKHDGIAVIATIPVSSHALDMPTGFSAQTMNHAAARTSGSKGAVRRTPTLFFTQMKTESARQNDGMESGGVSAGTSNVRNPNARVADGGVQAHPPRHEQQIHTLGTFTLAALGVIFQQISQPAQQTPAAIQLDSPNTAVPSPSGGAALQFQETPRIGIASSIAAPGAPAQHSNRIYTSPQKKKAPMLKQAAGAAATPE